MISEFEWEPDDPRRGRMTIILDEERTTTATAAPGVPQTVLNHFVLGPAQAIKGRQAEESVVTALRDYMIAAWDDGCARVYARSRSVTLAECSLPMLDGPVTRQCEGLLAATLRGELAPDEVAGPRADLMASQIFAAVRVVVEEMRRQMVQARSAQEASVAIREVVTAAFDHLENGLHGIGSRSAAGTN